MVCKCSGENGENDSYVKYIFSAMLEVFIVGSVENYSVVKASVVAEDVPLLCR